MRVNQKRIWQRIMQLAELTEKDKPYTRRAFTTLYLTARALLEQFFAEAGLTTELSPAANLIATRAGQVKTLPPIALGSHIDTVKAGGRFDGIAGVITALEVAQVLYEQRVTLKHPLVIIDFLSEEPSDYGLSCVGSRGHGGRLNESHFAMQNPAGETLGEAMIRMGADLKEALYWHPPAYKAFLELHIEQAKRLERNNTDIGVVTGFAGIWRYRVTVQGQTDHAGTTPMAERQDALVAASRLITVIREVALNDKSDLVATVGQLALNPNAVNAVPGRVEFSLEIRCLDAGKRDVILDALTNESVALGETVELEPITSVPPAPCDAGLQKILGNACDALGFSHLTLSSGAGHDAYHMNYIAPSAMIFIPSMDGRSHTPEEYSSPEQLARGAEVLLSAVLKLDEKV